MRCNDDLNLLLVGSQSLDLILKEPHEPQLALRMKVRSGSSISKTGNPSSSEASKSSSQAMNKRLFDPSPRVSD